jgi:cell division protease FtsH
MAMNGRPMLRRLSLPLRLALACTLLLVMAAAAFAVWGSGDDEGRTAGPVDAAAIELSEASKDDGDVPGSVTGPLDGAGDAAIVPYPDLVAAADRGDLVTAVVAPAAGWVAGADRAGAVVAAQVPAKGGIPGTTEESRRTERQPGGALPSTAALGERLRANGVVLLAAESGDVGGGEPAWLMVATRLVLPLVLIGGLAAFLVFHLRRQRSGAGGRGGAGQIRKDVVVLETGVRFADVAGCDEAVEELREIVDFLSAPERFERVGARMPRGVILHGPPGTGKTLLAKAVAGESGATFFAVSGSDFVEVFVGQGAARVRDLFALAAKCEGGAVIFFDEIDAVGRARSSGPGSNDEREQTLNQLLVSMDGFDTSSRVVVIAATNRVDLLDQALTRPGRFDRQVRVDLPAERGRLEILRVHAKNKPIADPASLERLARVTMGSSGATLHNILNEAAIMAARDGRETITDADLVEGQLRALAGPRKRDAAQAADERRVVAWHEAGHALAAELCPTHEKTQRVSIQPRGLAGGLALYGQTDRMLLRPQQLHERLVTILGGRAAEEIAFGSISSGASNDLERATELARQGVELLGFAASVGQVVTAGHGAAPVADETRREIDVAVRRLVEDAYEDALRLLGDHRADLDRLAGVLLERQELDREAICEVLAEVCAGGVASQPKAADGRLSLREATHPPTPPVRPVPAPVPAAASRTRAAGRQRLRSRLSAAFAVLRDGGDRDAAGAG